MRREVGLFVRRDWPREDGSIEFKFELDHANEGGGHVAFNEALHQVKWTVRIVLKNEVVER